MKEQLDLGCRMIEENPCEKHNVKYENWVSNDGRIFLSEAALPRQSNKDFFFEGLKIYTDLNEIIFNYSDIREEVRVTFKKFTDREYPDKYVFKMLEDCTKEFRKYFGAIKDYPSGAKYDVNEFVRGEIEGGRLTNFIGYIQKGERKIDALRHAFHAIGHMEYWCIYGVPSPKDFIGEVTAFIYELGLLKKFLETKRVRGLTITLSCSAIYHRNAQKIAARIESTLSNSSLEEKIVAARALFRENLKLVPESYAL